MSSIGAVNGAKVGGSRAYLAGAFGRRLELREVAGVLADHGVIVGARWLDAFEDPTETAARARAACVCLEDIAAADVVIAFAGTAADGYQTGGRHVETGIALARGMPVILVGDRENVFHALGWVKVVPNVPALLDALGALGLSR